MRKFRRDEKGSAIVLVALSMVALLCITGLAIDGSMLYMTKSKLQKVANAAALSGAQELTNTEEKVTKVVNNILTSHKEPDSLEGLAILEKKKVQVNLSKRMPLSFAGLLGFQAVDVKAAAAASIAPMGRAVGAAPLGIDERVPLEYYKEYKLKTDETGVSSGNFGILALGGPGARTYEENLQYGYRDEIKVGAILNTETGNIAGKTISVVNELVKGCTYLPEDVSERNCSRIILIPVYKEYDKTSNQLKAVQVTGFAYFYITQPMSSNDTSITGMFIKRAGTGFSEVGSLDKGAYIIRLTE
ncbi:TadE/TadG family type IV pilus assembly protein [Bacillus sp. EB01]|uniref:TadE/TadG family type IV pilus assembly protein n=1 Tax=Bacillus sp. EB01 TaxID=1347086 RepID=UPI0005C754ED|nr:Tad domain-containing protein [Bacillus sp. EB01]